jgi:hypothetical protein
MDAGALHTFFTASYQIHEARSTIYAKLLLRRLSLS